MKDQTIGYALLAIMTLWLYVTYVLDSTII
jgi:hypothetical protein